MVQLEVCLHKFKLGISNYQDLHRYRIAFQTVALVVILCSKLSCGIRI